MGDDTAAYVQEAMRVLSDGADHDEPRSAIFIEGCSFIVSRRTCLRMDDTC